MIEQKVSKKYSKNTITAFLLYFIHHIINYVDFNLAAIIDRIFITDATIYRATPKREAIEYL